MWGAVKDISARGAVAAALLLQAVLPASSRAVCAVGGTSALPPPAATHLRSYAADLDTPSRLAVDAAGNVYIADPGRRQVVVRAVDGRVVHRAGELGRPISVAVSPDRIYVGDEETGSIRVLDRAWTPLSAIAAGTGGLLQPGDLAIDSGSGRLYVADPPTHRIHVYEADGSFVTSFGEEGSGDGQFRFPTGVFVDSAAGEVLVADQLNYRIQIFDRNGAFLSCFGAQGGTPGRFNMPQGVLVDGAGRIHVADALEGRVQVLDRAGAPLGTIGEFGEALGQLRIPVGMVLDPSQRLFVSAVNNARLEVYGLDDYSDPEMVLPATLRLHPEPLDRAAPPPFVTAILEVPGYALDRLAFDTVRANTTVAAGGVRRGDANGNGIADAQLSFATSPLLATLPAAGPTAVTVAGLLDGRMFEATALLQVTTCDAATHCPLGDADPQCNEAVCLAEFGCTVRPRNEGGGCEDGDACSIDDTCNAGACAGAPLTCDDRNGCTDDRCDAATGCEYVPNDAPCDDGDACTDLDTCGNGSCSGTAVVCDDHDVCTDDSCDPGTGCQFAFNSAPCDDGNACTTLDACSAGSCAGAAVNCDDGNPCTDEFCNPASGCRTIANGAGCDDGDACTALDTCSAGSCTGATVSCEDDNPCTDDDCDPASGCTHATNSARCDDADPGTARDICSGGGVCRGDVVTGEFAILALPAPGARGQRLSLGRQAIIGGGICADTMLLRSRDEIAGDVVATATSGRAITLQRSVRIAGDLVTGGAAAGQLARIDVAGRIDLSGSGAELADCAAARFRAARRREEILAVSKSPDLALADVRLTPGETRRLVVAAAPASPTVFIDSGAISLAPNSTLLIAADGEVDAVIVRVAGRMTIGPAAQIALDNLAPEQVLLVVGGPVVLNRNASVAGTVLAANRVRLGIHSSVAGALIGGNLDLEPRARIDHHPFAAW